MDHEIAVQTHAAWRYVFEKMSSAERDWFEDHYFGCPICAAHVEAAERLRERVMKRRGVYRILEVSLELFRERGYTRVALSEVAARAWVTEGSIFRRFGSKLRLLIQTIRCRLLGAIEPADLTTEAMAKL